MTIEVGDHGFTLKLEASLPEAMKSKHSNNAKVKLFKSDGGTLTMKGGFQDLVKCENCGLGWCSYRGDFEQFCSFECKYSHGFKYNVASELPLGTCTTKGLQRQQEGLEDTEFKGAASFFTRDSSGISKCSGIEF